MNEITRLITLASQGDPSVTSERICSAIHDFFKSKKISNVKNIVFDIQLYRRGVPHMSWDVDIHDGKLYNIVVEELLTLIPTPEIKLS